MWPSWPSDASGGLQGISGSVFAVVVLVAIVGAVAFALALSHGSPKYLAQPLMTRNELEFFSRLSRALPELHVFPQVAMSALIRPASRGKSFRAAFARISQKRVDWVVCRKESLAVVAVIELDDRTHNVSADAARDAMMRTAGLTTLRFASRAKPSVDQIRSEVLALMKDF